MSIPSTATQKPSGPCKCSAYLDWLQMLSGVGLILFMLCHMTLVSSELISAETMNSIAGFFEDTGLIFLVGPGVFALFLVHFVLAARKIPFVSKQQSIMWANAKRMNHLDTWMWVIQAVTAMIILIMGSIHMWTVLSDLPITAAKSAARMQHASWAIFYVVLVPVIWLHVGAGFYRIAVKWGFVGRAGRIGFRFKTYAATAVIIVIGLASITSYLLHSVK
jgi:fumarate reductase subunit C